MTVPPSRQRNSGLSRPENNLQTADIVARSRQVEPQLDALMTEVKRKDSAPSYRPEELEGVRVGSPLTWTARDEVGYQARLAAWKAAGSPEPPGCSLPPMRGPAYKKRGRR